HRLPCELIREGAQVDAALSRGRREQLEHAAVDARDEAPTVLAIEPRHTGADGLARHQAGSMEPPALVVHVRESTGERRRDRAHEIVDSPCGSTPVDAAVLRRASPAVLTLVEVLRMAGCRALGKR